MLASLVLWLAVSVTHHHLTSVVAAQLTLRHVHLVNQDMFFTTACVCQHVRRVTSIAVQYVLNAYYPVWSVYQLLLIAHRVNLDRWVHSAILDIVQQVQLCYIVDCPNGYYVNFVNNLNITCMTCNTTCTLCYGATSTSCLACSTGYFLDSTSCSTSCSLNTTYQNTISNICSVCNVPCLTCQPTNGSACTSCVVGFLNQPVCTLVCNSTSYPLLTSQIYICTLCPVQCATCYSDSINLICTSCVSPNLLYAPNNSCITASNCPAGYYNDTVNLKCSACLSPCVTCYNSGIKCLTCTANTYFVNGLSYCVDTCAAGYYLSANSCWLCDSSCSECTGTSTNCTKCSITNMIQYFLYNNTCLAVCPSFYYA
jgi:hypothetical protein